MNFPALEIPDEDRERALWLERQLVGLDLGDLIAQLLVVQQSSANVSLEEALGPRISEILRSGLSSLSPDEISGLLSCPEILLELQSRIFIEGGAYWQTVSRTPEHLAAVERVNQAVDQQLFGQTTANETAPLLAPASKTSSAKTWTWPLGIAAAVLIAAGWWTFRQAPPVGWGFDRPGLLAEADSGPAYLRILADAACEWSKKRPATVAELRTRLQQFDAGCETLIAAEHRQLAPKDRTWLVANCRRWQKEIRRLVDQLNSGAELSNIRNESDVLVEELRKAILDRAATA